MSISKRFIELRNTLGLSRKKFCSEIDVPIRTIEAIENEGNTPRSSLVEKIVAKWPEYALWLITGSVEFRSEQTCPNIIQKKQINIVDVCDPRFIHNGLINSKLLKDCELIFIQNLEEPSQLAALIKLEEFTVENLSSQILKNGFIWLTEGFLRFDENDDGISYLTSLRNKLYSVDKKIITSAQYKGLSSQDFKLASQNSFILFESLQEINDESLLSNFEKLKEGSKYTDSFMSVNGQLYISHFDEEFHKNESPFRIL
ncbi:helix-turn-helix domain-containing protein [Marinomonas sp. 2405UD68-3]|uniref:helix-turn-helix domain-containing protein n=1 Tax=Marinomonas sp. 2405UD68-3 TaxID=3391835 RepID=UPI0039C9884D